MPVPASKVSQSHGRRRRSHDALKVKQVSTCAACKSALRPHHACPNCGTYNGRKAIAVGASAEKILKKAANGKSTPKTKETPKS